MKRNTSEATLYSYPKNKIKVVLFENVHKKAVEILKNDGFDVELLAGALSGEELADKLKDARVIGVRSKTKLTKPVLQAAKKLMCIGCFCIGTDQTDLDVAEELAIPVFNSPFSNSRSVAELIIASVINLARELTERTKEMHNDSWQKTAVNSNEIRGKTIGIIGYGHIGSQLSVLAEALGMTVIYKDVKNIMPLGNARQVETLGELLSQSDFVTLHVPDTQETRYMIRKEQISMMKDGAYLLNASRGQVVDLDDLATALKTQKLRGAMVDVYPKEPAKNGSITDQGVTIPLVGLRNVILTPHIGGSTSEAQEAIGIEVAQKILNYMNQGVTDGAVNFPNIVPPAQKNGQHRLLNVHRNEPGVLRQLLNIISDVGNVSYQTVNTTDKVGYFVCDVSSSVSEEVISQISDIKENIRSRMLY
ncbi:D-3-phosphoglycerate dehydrogenase [Diplonema papillatum]|nr:D-3-phosphoglycerate dehydrogenase [Diplonema papillatum]